MIGRSGPVWSLEKPLKIGKRRSRYTGCFTSGALCSASRDGMVPSSSGLTFTMNSHTAARSRGWWWMKQRSREAQEVEKRSRGAVAAHLVLLLRITLLPVHSPPGHPHLHILPPPSDALLSARARISAVDTSFDCTECAQPLGSSADAQRLPSLSRTLSNLRQKSHHPSNFGVWRNLWRLEKQADGFFQAQPMPASSSSLIGGCPTAGARHGLHVGLGHCCHSCMSLYARFDPPIDRLTPALTCWCV